MNQSDVVETTSGRVLVLDDDPDLCALLESGLGRRGHDVATATSVQDAHAALATERFEALLLDLKLGSVDGLEVCRQVVERHVDLPVIVVTGHGSMDAAVGAIRVGAYDFTTKPVDLDALALMVERAVKHHRLSCEVRRLRDERNADAKRSKRILGESRAVQRLLDFVARVAPTDSTVLISGDSGTGKELVARALHDGSPRAGKPFIAVNCAAIPASLLESELFGHVRGAFTDAKGSRKGLLAEAEGGTLLLDEISEMSIELQAKLLRVLQERKVRPVGASHEQAFDVRVIAATHQDLEEAVDRGTFREDLFHRIHVIRIDVPSLAERGHDVLLLAQHFVEQLAQRVGKDVVGISAEAARKLLDYDWPGNVRELENAMERAVTLTRHQELTVGDLPKRIREHQPETIVLSDQVEHMLTLREIEERYIKKVLKATRGNKTRAAAVLGLDRRTLYRKLERLAKSSPS